MPDARCPDCNENPTHPHEMGAHLPGCGRETTTVAAAIAVWTPTHKTWRRRRG